MYYWAVVVFLNWYGIVRYFLRFNILFFQSVSYDEKPGIQAIATTSPDLPPTVENGTIKRDYEYKRLGTVSLLTAIDLLTGEAIPLVRDTHKSEDFIDFLKKLNEKYPEGDTIQVILDNHTVHTSKKIKQYLKTVPGRFVFIVVDPFS
nr:transposase [[Clostridium] aminophilum]